MKVCYDVTQRKGRRQENCEKGLLQPGLDTSIITGICSLCGRLCKNRTHPVMEGSLFPACFKPLLEIPVYLFVYPREECAVHSALLHTRNAAGCTGGNQGKAVCKADRAGGKCHWTDRTVHAFTDLDSGFSPVFLTDKLCQPVKELNQFQFCKAHLYMLLSSCNPPSSNLSEWHTLPQNGQICKQPDICPAL